MHMKDKIEEKLTLEETVEVVKKNQVVEKRKEAIASFINRLIL